MSPLKMAKKLNSPQPQVRRNRTCATHPTSNGRVRLQEVLERNTAQREAQRMAHETSPYSGSLDSNLYGQRVCVPHKENVEQAHINRYGCKTEIVSAPIVLHGTVVRLNSAQRRMSPDSVGLKLANGQVWILPAANVAQALTTAA